MSTVAVPGRTATCEEMEQRFGISAGTWARWARLGKVAGFKVGRRVLLDLDEVEQLVASGRIGPAAPAAAEPAEVGA